MRWDPQQYGRYAGERARPFVDLLARVGATTPRRVVDVGCGPGALTALLADRWPQAVVEGIDSSPEMIATARPLRTDRLTFRVEDAAEWAMPADTDVVISNAVLQWVPGHRDLVDRWARGLPAGGWLAFQVPGNYRAPSHALLRELADAPRWVDALHSALEHDAVDEPASYGRLLQDAGLEVDVWETTYLHVLTGADPVLEWLRGTALRPVLAALCADDAAAFCAEFAERLRAAYPATQHGTLFDFRRVFAVAHH